MKFFKKINSVAHPVKIFETKRKKAHWGKRQFLKVVVVISGRSEKLVKDWF